MSTIGIRFHVQIKSKKCISSTPQIDLASKNFEAAYIFLIQYFYIVFMNARRTNCLISVS